MKMRKLWYWLAFMSFGIFIVFSIHCMRRSRSTPIMSGAEGNVQPSIISDFPIPARLLKSGLGVTQILTGGQKGVTCGSHAVINARAIQLTLESGGQLTNEAMRSNAQVLDSFIQKGRLSNEEIYNLANYIGLKHYLVFAYNDKAGSFYEVHHSDSFGPQTKLRNIFRMIESKREGNYHFILNTGRHWVLVSVIRVPDRPAQILYLDSLNKQLKEGSLGMFFVAYLINSIFQMNL